MHENLNLAVEMGELNGLKISDYVHNSPLICAEYLLLEVLDKNAQAELLKVKFRPTGDIRELRIIFKSAFASNKDCDAFYERLKIIQTFGHPNLVKYHETLADEKKIYIV